MWFIDFGFDFLWNNTVTSAPAAAQIAKTLLSAPHETVARRKTTYETNLSGCFVLIVTLTCFSQRERGRDHIRKNTLLELASHLFQSLIFTHAANKIHAIYNIQLVTGLLIQVFSFELTTGHIFLTVKIKLLFLTHCSILS